jgi:subtilisin family serine protease
MKKKQSLNNMVKAIRHAINIGADFINISGGGPGRNQSEHQLVKEALDKGIIFVAAAGNDGHKLGSMVIAKTNRGAITRYLASYYPAMYDERVIVVGNGENSANRRKTSNYGEVVDVWENGTFPIGAYGNRAVRLEGTSQATALVTGKLVRMYVQSRRHFKSKHE